VNKKSQQVTRSKAKEYGLVVESIGYYTEMKQGKKKQLEPVTYALLTLGTVRAWAKENLSAQQRSFLDSCLEQSNELVIEAVPGLFGHLRD